MSIKKENINHYYEVVAKVPAQSLRNSEKVHLEQSIRGELRGHRDPGELLKKFPSKTLRTLRP